MTEYLRMDPETNLPRPIYKIDKSGTLIVMRPTFTNSYDKLYFNRTFKPGDPMPDSAARRIKKVTLTQTTVNELWPELVKHQGYQYM